MTWTLYPRAISFIKDPRYAQVLALGVFIFIGKSWFHFDVRPLHALSGILGAVGAQYIACRALKLRFDPLSPLITGLSLTLLFRSSAPEWAALAGVAAIASKFTLRWRGRHVFNPANFALVTLAALTSAVWISPGQWGSALFLALGFIVAGLIVTGRAGRWDTSLSYLAVFAALSFGRAAWYGDPLAIPAHQLQSGALLLFAFFMISDPMTTPCARPARMIFAALVACVGFAIAHGLHRAAGPLGALLLCAPIVPILDHLFPAAQPRWRPQPESSACPSPA